MSLFAFLLSSCVAALSAKALGLCFLLAVPVLNMHAFMAEHHDLDESVHQIECVM